MFQLCPPALIYLIFSLTQIIIDLFKGLFNTAIMKALVAFMITFLLNTLCSQGLTVISWIIVFVPFILMTTIVSILLYVFGLDIANGKIGKIGKKSCEIVSPPASVLPSSLPRSTYILRSCPIHGMSESTCSSFLQPPYGSSSTAYKS